MLPETFISGVIGGLRSVHSQPSPVSAETFHPSELTATAGNSDCEQDTPRAHGGNVINPPERAGFIARSNAENGTGKPSENEGTTGISRKSDLPAWLVGGMNVVNPRTQFL
jgi:hypothetical protein